MVYCGKPSKGCAPCRAKRTKCDQKQPSCSQCLRTGRFCQGYRFASDVEFRDQSQDVVNRQIALSKKRRHAPLLPAETTFDMNASSSPELTWNRSRYLIPMEIPPLPEDAAVNCFFNYYVVDKPFGLSSSKAPNRLFNLLPGLYQAAPAGSPLSATIVALGLACLSASMKIPTLMMQANAKYAYALTHINSALRDPVVAKRDETLLVIMMLALYEENNTTTKSCDPWTSHIRGALALLDYRGQEQLQQSFGLELLRTVRMQVIVNCLIRQTEVPRSILQWSKSAREYENQEEISESEMADIYAKYCHLQAIIQSCHDYIDPVKVIDYASRIEADLVSWLSKWESCDLYTSIMVQERCADVFSDYWHHYPNFLVANLWNNYRSLRIHVNRVIIETLARLSECHPTDSILEYSATDQDQVERSKQIIVQLSLEICATVPFYMGRGLYHDEEWESPYSLKNAAKAKLVIWPLHVVGHSDFVSDDMRLWIADQLEKFGDTMGLMKSKVLGQMLRLKQRPKPKEWRDLGLQERFIQ